MASEAAGTSEPTERSEPPGPANPGRASDDVRLTVCVAGRVQGVGFRWWTRRQAEQLGLAGYAANLDDGRVEIVVEGPRDAAERLLAAVRESSAPGRVSDVSERWSAPRGDLGRFQAR